MRIVILTNGYSTIVDDCDFEKLSDYSWYAKRNRADGKLYVVTSIGYVKLYMHRLILDAQDSELVDHIDNNGLNNRRDNLRKTDNGSNVQRQPLRLDSRSKTSKYRGVRGKSDQPRSKPWQAIIASTSLGYYATEEEAAKVYDEYAVRFYGEHAFTNFPR